MAKDKCVEGKGAEARWGGQRGLTGVGVAGTA